MSRIDLYPNLKSPPSDAKVATGTAISGDKFAIDVSIAGSTGTLTGDFTPSGLKTAGRITTMNVTDTVTLLPTTNLTARNSLSITNLSAGDTLYVGFSNLVTADRTLGTNAGWEVGPNEGLNFDITDDIDIYGIAEAGKTVLVKIMELA